MVEIARKEAEAGAKAKGLLICADSGGSNSSLSRTWRLNRSTCRNGRIGDRHRGLPLPRTASGTRSSTGCSSFIGLSWKGQRLINCETTVKSDRSHKNQDRVQGDGSYETHSKWNYTIRSGADRTLSESGLVMYFPAPLTDFAQRKRGNTSEEANATAP